MKSIKPRGLLIGNKKFQLVGPKGKKSKEININQTKKIKRMFEQSSRIVEKGIDSVRWSNKGYSIKPYFHDLFLKKLMEVKNKNKKVLIIGQAFGYEAKYIKQKAKRVTIDTFDIIDTTNKDYKKYINKEIIFDKGIENYQNKEMVGKYDAITSAFGLGYYTLNTARNIVKTSLMLKPGGILFLNTFSSLPKQEIKEINKYFKSLKLDNIFIPELIENGNIIIITRKKD